MAVITAKFDADFSSFQAGTKQAEQDLEAFAATVDSSVVSVDDMAQAMRDMEDPVSGMNTQFSEFDSILKLAGVNIGQYNKALGELGNLLGLSASTMALIGPAAAVVGTALAAWELGTLIGEWTGLTDAIANWGTQAEAAGAEADAIALAFQRTGQEARSGAEALRLNTDWLKANQTQQKATAEEAARTTKILADHKAQLEASTRAFIEWSKEQTDRVSKRFEEQVKAERLELTNWAAAMTEVRLAEGAWLEVVNAMEPALVDRIKNLQAEGVSAEALTRVLGVTDTQLQAVARSREFDNQMLREAKTLHDEVIPVTEDLAQKLYEEARALDAVAASQGAVNAATQATAAAQKTLTFTPIPIGGGGGGGNPSGMRATLPTHVTTYPAGVFSGGSGPFSQPTVNVHGVLLSNDPAAREALAQAVSAAMMGQMRGGGQQMGRG